MIATTAFILLLVSLISQVVTMMMRNRKNWQIPVVTGAITALLLVTELVRRSLIIRFIALTNTYESILFFSAIVSIVGALYLLIYRERIIPFASYGMTILAMLLLAVASSPIASSMLSPPVPALQSGWLLLHVAFSFIGEAFFAFAFGVAVYYLFAGTDEARQSADRLIRTSIMIGYPVFTTGALLFGAIWAQSAWGRFWGWDPKEVFALVTWLVYTVYLHLRFVKKVPKLVEIWTVIIGFVLTLFTFFGVNYLLPSLHSAYR
jgi:ABC-type transport system involved in cytochrome c biogenesis permease subunit